MRRRENRVGLNLKRRTVMSIFQISGKSVKTVKQLAANNGLNIGQVLRRAIAVYKFLCDESKKGNKINICDADGNVIKELIMQ